MMDRCRVEILDDNNEVVNTVDVDPIFAEKAIDDHAHKLIVPPQLLHSPTENSNDTWSTSLRSTMTL
jgi:hypothetical protein